MRDTYTRVLLALTVFNFALVGVWAALAPKSFYDDFPGGGHHWVSVNGPYNEHLVRDVGTLNLALAAIALAALVRPVLYLVQVLAGAALVNAAPHFLYHLFHLDVFSTTDKVAQTTSLAVTVIVPALLLLHAWRAPQQPNVSTPQDGSPAWR
jgi:hypothetical protein